MRRILSNEIPAYEKVSIHAPREGCDITHFQHLQDRREFQFTHPGRGATQSGSPVGPVGAEFQFTHPGRGATQSGSPVGPVGAEFQFTHPGRGATKRKKGRKYLALSFNSRTPGGVRHLAPPGQDAYT